MGYHPHRPHRLGSSEMTMTISQPCLEFTELGLTTMAAPSAHSKFCCQQKDVFAQAPTLDEVDAPECMGSSWAASASWTLPIPLSLLCPGLWTHPAHRLLSHICRGMLDAELPQEMPSTHSGKGLSVTRVGWERGPSLGWSSSVTFLFLRAKGRGLLGGGAVLRQYRLRSHTFCW